jgi:ABC-2 type transport system ATP-binding protein
MRRRLEIARGLIHYPKILFLDEPTIGLDPQTRDHIWTYIEELKEAQNITIVLTTHYMEEADKLSDRVGIIDFGKIVALDTPAKLKGTLEGDVITVTTKDAEKLSTILTGRISVQKTHVIENRLELTVREGQALLPKVIEIAAENGIHVEAVVLHQPSLQDVFLHYTGRAIRAEAGHEPSGESAVRRRAAR